MEQLQVIQNKIYEIRGQLKQSVKRNIKRFPTDFMFELTKEEFCSLRSQFVISNKRGGHALLGESKRHVTCAFVTVRQYLTSANALSKRLKNSSNG